MWSGENQFCGFCVRCGTSCTGGTGWWWSVAPPPQLSIVKLGQSFIKRLRMCSGGGDVVAVLGGDKMLGVV